MSGFNVPVGPRLLAKERNGSRDSGGERLQVLPVAQFPDQIVQVLVQILDEIRA